MEITRSFDHADRYKYDRQCSLAKGWAQVDTQQDASYFGMWANPTLLQVVTYAEGDVTVVQAANAQEFVEEINKIVAWNKEEGIEFYGIDCGCGNQLSDIFQAIGVNPELLH